MADANRRMTFCYVSGVGTDSTERGRTMWARVKGRTENALLALPFKAAFMFRPGYIQPIGDVQSKTGWVQTAYDILAPLYPLVHRLLPNGTTTTANLGRALIQVAATGYSKSVLYPARLQPTGGHEMRRDACSRQWLLLLAAAGWLRRLGAVRRQRHRHLHQQAARSRFKVIPNRLRARPGRTAARCRV